MAISAYVGFHPKSGAVFQFDYRLRFYATIYGVGCALKFMGLGPDYVRWHLADLGFPAAITAAFVAVYGYWYKKNQTDEEYASAKRTLAQTAIAQRIVPIAVMISCCYELLAHLAVASTSGEPVYIGGFDWIDIVCYFISGLLVFFTARKLRRTLTNAFVALEEATARLEELKKAAAKAKARSGNPALRSRRPNKRKRR